MLEVFQGVSVGINTLVLLLLVFKYLQDMRRQRLDMEQQRLAMEKLHYELEGMKTDLRSRQSELVRASEDDVRKYVVEPLAEEIRRASLQLRDAAHESAGQLTRLVYAIAESPPQDRERGEAIGRAQLDLMTAIHEDLRQLTAALTPIRKLANGLREALDGMEAPSNKQRGFRSRDRARPRPMTRPAAEAPR
jgi:hypothetical protein